MTEDADSETFRAALIAGDMDALRLIPKSDLHNHIVAGGTPDLLPGASAGYLEHKLRSMDEMHAWVDGHYGKFLSSAEGRFEAIHATFTSAKRDGVTLLAGGEDIWAPTAFDMTAETLTDTLKRIHRAAAPDLEWLPQLDMSRHCPVEALNAWLIPFLELGFYRTMDLSGDEFAQPIEAFRPLYREAKAQGLRLKAHVGEWGDADSVWRAVEELELDEVQHGIAAAQSPAVMRFLTDHRVRLNICPTSNVMLGRVDSMTEHPIRNLFEAGVIVTVNTDDMLVFGQSVSAEFLNLFRAGCLDAFALDEIRRNGLVSS